MEDLPNTEPEASSPGIAADPSTLSATAALPRAASLPLEAQREIAVAAAVDGFRHLLSPATDLLARTRQEQQQLVASVLAAKQQSNTVEQHIAAVEPTFARLPLYIAKLELMARNMKTLHENATKTKLLAKKLQDEVRKLVGN